jgi:hypothetical protein
MEADIEVSDRYDIDIDCILAKVRKVIHSKHVTSKEAVQSSQNLNPNAEELYVNSDPSNSTQIINVRNEFEFLSQS